MIPKFNQRRKLPWGWVLAAETVLLFFLSVLTALSLYLGKPAHILFLYLFLPLAGGGLSLCAVLLGVNNYLAFLPCAPMYFLGYLLIWKNLPGPGPFFVCLLISLIGASTGEVMRQRDRKPIRRKKH